jgi:23S rRNA (cytosine1962-C5)-methyltransferase
MEGLELRKGLLKGTSSVASFIEDGLSFQADILAGQKTGFFLDQRENRRLVAQWSKNLSVLDCFCNDGGFALHAGKLGAKSVLGIDSSREAISNAAANAQRNNLTNVAFEMRDVFDALDEFHAKGRTFDVIILDPPSFTRNKKGVPAARQGYRDLHRRAFRVLAPTGFLATASCSHHIESEAFLTDIHVSARKSGRMLQMLDWRGAAPDHPAIPGVSETAYLKFGLFRAIRTVETSSTNDVVEDA